MNEETGDQQQNPEQSPGISAGNILKGGKKVSLLFKISSLSSLTLPAIVFVVFFSIVMVMIAGKVGEASPNTQALASGTHCEPWDGAPAGYKEKIEAAANQACDNGKCLQPALLGAIFLSEHGDAWPTWGPGAYKSDFLVAHPDYDDYKTLSPFQFEPSTWKQYSNNAPLQDMMDYDIASRAAARFVASILSNANLPLDTVEENHVKCAGGGYNSGPDDCKQWARKGFPSDPAPSTHPDPYTGSTRIFTTNEYDERTWTNFQRLNVNCSPYAGFAELATLPFLSQGDDRWNHPAFTDGARYFPGRKSFKGAGCGATSAAMVATFLTGQEITPIETGSKFISCSGSWAAFDPDCIDGVKVASLRTTIPKGEGEFPLAEIQAELEKKHPVIMRIDDDGTGYKKQHDGHYTVIKGLANGNFITNDPTDGENTEYTTIRTDYDATVKFYSFSRK